MSVLHFHTTYTVRYFGNIVKIFGCVLVICSLPMLVYVYFFYFYTFSVIQSLDCNVVQTYLTRYT